MIDYNGWWSRAIAGMKHLLLGVLFLLSFVWPKDDALWAFGANDGKAFVDNSKYLYLHAVEERENVTPVWIAKDRAVVETLQSRGYKAYYAFSLQGIRVTLRAGVVFVSHGTRDVNMWCSGGATVVGLWHGVMLKQVSWDAGRDVDHPVMGLIERGKYTLFKRFDWLTVTSEAMVEPFASGRGMDPSRVVATGYPRNDLLDGGFPEGIETETKSETGAEIYETAEKLHEESDVLLYAPTFHEETGQHIRDHLDLSKLDALLADIDAYLIVKPHPRDRLDTDRGEFSRIMSMSSALDVYPLLPATDVLITDYSSLYFDYLLLDRPVVFYPFDREQYRATRGFNLDYDEVTPGPIATEFEELLTSIEAVLEDDDFAAERKAVRDEFLQPPSTNRCAAVCDQFDPAVPAE